MMLNSPTIISLLFLPASPNYVYMNHIINAPMHFIQLVKKPNDICWFSMGFSINIIIILILLITVEEDLNWIDVIFEKRYVLTFCTIRFLQRIIAKTRRPVTFSSYGVYFGMFGIVIISMLTIKICEISVNSSNIESYINYL